MTPGISKIQVWALPVVILLYWLQLFNQLRFEWTSNPQYGYGWFVPLLAAGMFWRRWSCRPSPRPMAPDSKRDWILVFIAGVLALLILPARIGFESSIGWRATYWVQAFSVTMLSCFALWISGGRVWLRHFLFPVLFLLVAVPWPKDLESMVVQGLMRGVAAATVEVLAVIGVPAIQHGAVLEVSSGLVGIDEACSGVRSLQTGIMFGFFLGELYQLRPWRRLGAVFLAVGVALLANIGRTTFLTWAAATYGLEKMHGWHDAAGNSVVVFTMGVTWGTILLLRSKRRSGESESGSAEQSGAPAFPRLVPLSLLICLGLFVPVSEALTESWFRDLEPKLVQNPDWTISWPASQPSFQKEPIPQRSLDMLQCDKSDAAAWIDDHGNQWHLFWLKWNRDNTQAIESTGHSPEVCLGNAGWNLSGRLPARTIQANGIDLTFLGYVFEVQGRTAYVFVNVWKDRRPVGQSVQDAFTGRWVRVMGALAGERRLEHRKIEIALIGANSAEEAFDALKSQLQQVIQPAVH